MKVFLTSATQGEIAPLLSVLQPKQVSENYYLLDMNNTHIEIVISGIGMTAMAFCCGKHLNSSFDLAINAGIAGSFDRTINIGDVVLVNEDTFSELGAEDGEKFLSLEEIKLNGKLAVGSYQLAKTLEILQTTNCKFLTKKAITVNTVHGNDASIKKIIERLKPQVESMEGAAFFYACEQLQVPALQLRSISNYVERRNRDNWNISLAVKNLNNSLIQLLKSL